MTVLYCGAISFDEVLLPNFDSGYSNKGYPLQATGSIGALHDQDATPAGDNPNSRGGFQITAISNAAHTWRQGYIATSKAWISHNWTMRFADQVDADPSDHGTFAYMYTSQTHAQAGSVRVLVESDKATPQIRLKLQVKGIVYWSDITGWGAGISYSGSPPRTAWMVISVQVDTSPAGDSRARLIINGDYASPYLAWTGHADIDAAMGNDLRYPSLGNGIVSQPDGNEDLFTHWAEQFTFAGDSEADLESVDLSSAAGTRMSVFAYYPDGDKPDSEWDANGNAAACSTDRWRCVDDMEDDEDGANDYVDESSADEQDQWFTVRNITDKSGETAAPVGVYIAAAQLGSTGVDSLGTRLGDTGGGFAAPVAGSNHGNGSWKYLWRYTDPGGGAWSKADFDDLQVALRSLASNAGKVYCVVIGVLGTGIARTATKGEVCAGAAQYFKTFAETASMSEAFSSTVAFAQAFAETMSLAETWSRGVSYHRAFAEALSAAEALVRKTGLHLAETMSLTEALTTRLIFHLAFLESLPFTEALSTVTKYGAAPAQTVRRLIRVRRRRRELMG